MVLLSPIKSNGNYKGFALVEILVALAIIALLVAAFTPLFGQAVANLSWAGERTADINTARGQIEERIGNQTGYNPGTVSVLFPGMTNPVTIDGGVIDDIENFKAFIPFAPSISLSPKEIKEGYPANTVVTVNGKNTNFNNSTTAKVVWANDTETTLTVQFVNSNRVQVTIPTGLLNCDDPYVMVVTTGTEVVRAVFNVRLPMAVAGGASGKAIVSGNGGYWESRTSGTSKNITGVKGYPNGFFAVGAEGTLLKLAARSPWTAVDSKTDNDLNNITSLGSTIIAVGNNGTVIQSTVDQSSFDVVSGLPSGVDNINLNGIATNNSVLVITGNDNRAAADKKNDGVIISVDSTNGTASIVPRDEQPINDVTWNTNKFVAVGNGGTIVGSDNGTDWPAVFNPGDGSISGLQLWLKADAISSADINASNTVTTWRDSSGHNNHATLQSGTTPTFVTSEVNGLPVVRFDSTGNDQLNLPSTSVATNTFTVFCVAKPTTSGTQKYLLAPDQGSGGTNSRAYMGLSLSTSSVNVYERSSTASTSRSSISLSNPPFGLVDVIYNGGASNLYYNNKSISSSATANKSWSYNYVDFPIKIGRCNDGAFFGDIAEILVYNRTLSSDERLQVDSYLASKYKLYGNYKAVCASPTTTVAVGLDGNIASAPNNSNTWTRRTSGTTANLNDVSWIADKFYAVGDGGVMKSSSDGITWNNETSGTTNDLFAIGS